jgi:glycine hydroxymethyltransferase
MSVAFKLDSTEQFRKLQQQIVKNAAAFTQRFKEHGFRIPFGGTNTHMMNIDCSSVVGVDKVTLSGDQAARILDIAGVVVNRNTIPGDRSAFDPSGIRMGTPWVTQRGFKEADMVELADIISDLLKSTTPFSLAGRKGDLRRSKVDFTVLESAKTQVRDLAQKAGIDFKASQHGYPHFYYIDEKMGGGDQVLELSGDRIRSFLNFVVASDVEALQPGDTQATCLCCPQGTISGSLTCVDPYTFQLSLPEKSASMAAAWLRDLSDGYVAFDEDPLRKVAGPVVVKFVKADHAIKAEGSGIDVQKPYFIEMDQENADPDLPSLPRFVWEEREGELRRTPVYETHKRLGAKLIPFAGWEMPVWYTSVVEEHLAVRQAAGLFDVAHMGVYEVAGPDADVFLDSVVGNDIGGLGIGESCYTHFLDPQADVIDDLLVYRRGPEKFLVVVNASNDDKDWTWLNAAKDGKVLIDNQRPWARGFGRNVVLRNLRDPQSGDDMRVDLALQGPRSRDILLTLGVDSETRKRIMALKRTELCDAIVGGFDLVVSRTGYTGEKMAFELFVHPDRSEELFNALLKAGETYGLKPIGLGARDSLRTEAGLPLYGHEMGGSLNNGVAEGGFGSYVKTYKPWFIGREAYLAREALRKTEVVRFRFSEKGVRMAHQGDPVIDKRGKVIGQVTSCAIDADGLLTGQANVDLKYAEEGTPLFIYQSAPDKAGKAPAELSPGDKTVLPTQAVVLSRFPK